MKEVFGWFDLKRIREYVSGSAPHIQAHRRVQQRT